MSTTTPAPVINQPSLPPRPVITPEMAAAGLVLNEYTNTLAFVTDEPITDEDVRRFLEEDELLDEQ